MLIAVLLSFGALLMGKLTDRYSTQAVSTKRDFLLLIVSQTIIGIAFPLLPLSVIFNLFLLILKANLFLEPTYSFACWAASNSYLLAYAGSIALPFYT